MIRIILKLICLYLLWVLVAVPAYRHVKGKVNTRLTSVKNVYWWMSPLKDGW